MQLECIGGSLHGKHYALREPDRGLSVMVHDGPPLATLVGVEPSAPVDFRIEHYTLRTVNYFGHRYPVLVLSTLSDDEAMRLWRGRP